jgi:hypothetical protein
MPISTMRRVQEMRNCACAGAARHLTSQLNTRHRRWRRRVYGGGEQPGDRFGEAALRTDRRSAGVEWKARCGEPVNQCSAGGAERSNQAKGMDTREIGAAAIQETKQQRRWR